MILNTIDDDDDENNNDDDNYVIMILIKIIINDLIFMIICGIIAGVKMRKYCPNKELIPVFLCF